MASETSRSSSGYGGVTEPCTVILFGASGDLAKRKVIPALYDLAIHNALGPRYALVGFARTAMTDESFRTTAGDAAKSISEVGPIDPKQWDEFAANMSYCAGDYGNPEAYAQLARCLSEVESAKNLGGNRLFYLSTPPEVYPDIVEQLGRASLARPVSPNSWVRIIIEKPFGREKSRSTASITTSARTPFRICSFFALATESLSRSGTATTSITFRSPRPKLLALSAVAVSMNPRARSAT